jgi:hypothetical protein
MEELNKAIRAIVGEAIEEYVEREPSVIGRALLGLAQRLDDLEKQAQHKAEEGETPTILGVPVDPLFPMTGHYTLDANRGVFSCDHCGVTSCSLQDLEETSNHREWCAWRRHFSPPKRPADADEQPAPRSRRISMTSQDYFYELDRKVYRCLHCGITGYSLEALERSNDHHPWCAWRLRLSPPAPGTDPLMEGALKALVSMAGFEPPTYQDPDDADVQRCYICHYPYLRCDDPTDPTYHYSYCRWRKIKEIVKALDAEGRLP